MSLFVKWKELLITQDSTRFVKACTLLQNAGVEYKERIQNMGHGNRRYGQIGSLGERAGCSNIYQIFVKATDLEHAKNFIAFLDKEHP